MQNFVRLDAIPYTSYGNHSFDLGKVIGSCNTYCTMSPLTVHSAVVCVQSLALWQLRTLKAQQALIDDRSASLKSEMLDLLTTCKLSRLLVTACEPCHTVVQCIIAQCITLHSYLLYTNFNINCPVAYYRLNIKHNIQHRSRWDWLGLYIKVMVKKVKF